MAGERNRVNIDLDDEAREGWELMAQHTGGSFTALGNVLGLAMKAAVENGLKDKVWRNLADQTLAANWERRHRRRRGD